MFRASTALVASQSSTQLAWMVTRSCIGTPKFPGMLIGQVHDADSIWCMIDIPSCRGSRSQYYDGAFVASNNDVDAHLDVIGYGKEVY